MATSPKTKQYIDHLNSQQWRQIRHAALVRNNHICEFPGCTKRAREVHHLTYANLGNESLSELEALCRDHHDVRDRDRNFQKDLRAAATYVESIMGHDWFDGLSEMDALEIYTEWLHDTGRQTFVEAWEVGRMGRVYQFPSEGGTSERNYRVQPRLPLEWDDDDVPF